MIYFLPFSFFGLMGFLLVSVAIDRKRARRVREGISLSVVIPCFNNGAFVRAAVESVFASWPRECLDVLVVNDCSTDDSGESIRELAGVFPIRHVHHPENKGKARGLNDAVRLCRHDRVLFLDADTEVNPEALCELVSRLEPSRGVAAVSAPCTPKNRGLLPSMQAIEYNMHRLSMGASNLTSAHALWGGCLLTRKSVFETLGGFETQAVAEDTDYAFRLNRAGYRVEQGFARVKTHVPHTLRAWFRQKTRWVAGAIQCGVRYPDVWVKNPVVILSILVYSMLALNGILNLFDNASGVGFVRDFAEVRAEGADIPEAISLMKEGDHYMEVVMDGVMMLMITLGTLTYVFPLVRRVRDLFKLIWVFPYLFGYLPLFTLVSACGFFFWGTVLRKIHNTQRAW